jgi:hypothetical protein
MGEMSQSPLERVSNGVICDKHGNGLEFDSVVRCQECTLYGIVAAALHPLLNISNVNISNVNISLHPHSLDILYL